MKFKLFGTEIYISFLFAAVITIMLATDKTGLLIPSLFAILIHEIGHLFAMWVLECAPKKIRLVPASVQITKPFGQSYRNDILIAICGPLVNFILFFVLYCNYLCFKNMLILYYALLNLIIGLFNSLPVTGLDGGIVLFSILAKKHGMDRAAVVIKIITLLTAAVVLVCAITLTVRERINISLYIVGIYLFIMALIKR